MARRLPLTVIGGFLGAGKTTLLNHWLRNTQGQRLAVLVNDFGALNIDAELIASNSGDAIALTNGCVCCQIGDDLSMALIGVLDSADRFDAVVIEASGVSDPWRIAQLGLADPGLTLDGVIVLVDASVVLQQSRDRLLADTLERQLHRADLVILNKTDMVGPEALDAVREWVTKVAGSARQCGAVRAQVPLGLLSGQSLITAAAAHAPSLPSSRESSGSAKHPNAITSHHRATRSAHADAFETWSCRPDKLFPETHLRAWLDAVPPGILRLKGLLHTDVLGWAEIQFAGRTGTLRAAAEPLNGAALVAIGLKDQLPLAALQALAADGAL